MSRPSITVGVDGSPASDAALLYALDEAVARRLQVSVVTVFWVGPVLAEHHQASLVARHDEAADVQSAAMARALADHEHPPVVRTHLVHGDPAAVLIEAAHHSTALVIGSEHTPLLRQVNEGSISARCVRNCAVPVTVVPWPPVLAPPLHDLDRAWSRGDVLDEGRRTVEFMAQS